MLILIEPHICLERDMVMCPSQVISLFWLSVVVYHPFWKRFDLIIGSSWGVSLVA